MRVCPVIGWLSRAGNQIGDAGAAALAEVFKGLVNLKELNLYSKQLLFVCAQYLITPPIFTPPPPPTKCIFLWKCFFLVNLIPPPTPLVLFFYRTFLIPPPNINPLFQTTPLFFLLISLSPQLECASALSSDGCRVQATRSATLERRLWQRSSKGS